MQYSLSLCYSGDKILIMKVNMMVQRLFAVLLMVVLVGLIPAENTQEVIVANAKELKITAKKITRQKDDAKMMLIPPTAKFRQDLI